MPLSWSSSSEEFCYRSSPNYPAPIRPKMDCSDSVQPTRKNSYSLDRFLQDSTSLPPRNTHRPACLPHSEMPPSQMIQSPTSSVGTYQLGQAGGRRPRLLLMGQRRCVFLSFALSLGFWNVKAVVEKQARGQYKLTVSGIGAENPPSVRLFSTKCPQQKLYFLNPPPESRRTLSS